MTIALSNVQAIQMDIGEELNVKPQRIDAIERAILRMKKLVEDLFLVARSDSATSANSQTQTTDLAQLVDAVAIQYREPYRAKDILFSQSGPQMSVMCDPEALSRSVENLLENALRYTPAGGRVEVNLQRHGGRALLVVSDTGIGIAKELQSRVFERFFRVEESRDRHR